MKIFCWVKQIIKRFIYEKTIRPFNTSDYYGSAMGRGKREIRRSASPSGLFLAVKYIEGPVSFGSPIGSTDLASLPSNNGDL